MKKMKMLLPVMLFLVLISCKNNDFIIDSKPPGKDSIWHTFKIENEDIRVLEVNSKYFLSDDVILTKDQFNYLSYYNAEKKPKSLIMTDFAKLWSNGKIYYTINNNVSANLSANINSAINWLSTNTPLTFAVKSSSNSNFVKFNSSTGNNSLIGMTGGEQLINLTSDASVSTAIHEILHACGIHHEMGRNDRDNYVTINTSNIYSNKMHNFNKVGVLASVDVGIFDSRSIMMYPSKTSDASFAKNINQNIITANNSNIVISPSSYPTTTDLLGINMLYGNEKPYLDYTVTYNKIFEDGLSGSYENEVICTFTFYADKAKTIPYIKQYPVPVVIENYSEQIINRVPDIERTYKQSILIPAGQNSFSTYGKDYIDREWGDIYFLEKSGSRPIYPSTHYR